MDCYFQLWVKVHHMELSVLRDSWDDSCRSVKFMTDSQQISLFHSNYWWFAWFCDGPYCHPFVSRKFLIHLTQETMKSLNWHVIQVFLFKVVINWLASLLLARRLSHPLHGVSSTLYSRHQQIRWIVCFFCVQVYASPGEIALQMRRSGLDVPMFLLDISHPDHIPPHIVACELMATVNAQKQELHDLKLLIDKENQNPS